MSGTSIIAQIFVPLKPCLVILISKDTHLVFSISSAGQMLRFEFL